MYENGGTSEICMKMMELLKYVKNNRTSLKYQIVELL